MKVLGDLNVVLDVLQNREPHVLASADVLSRIVRGEIAGAIAGHGVTTIYYLLSKLADRDRADEAVDWLLDHLEIVPEGTDLLRRARTLDLPDFEDAVVASAAELAGCDRIVTRNLGDFDGSPVTAVTPAELLVDLG
jgi:predicted nucleic acid-binding protein